MKIPAPNFKDMIPVNTMLLYEVNRNEYQPLIVENLPSEVVKVKDAKTGEEKEVRQLSAVLKPKIDLRIVQALANSLRDLNLRFREPSFWERWGPLMSVAVTGLILLILIYGTLQQLGPLADKIGGLGASVTEAAKNCRVYVPTPTPPIV